MDVLSQASPINAVAGVSSALRPIDYIVCDVFTPIGLAGNQLAVFPRAAGLGDRLRAALAREMNYSESVFLSSSHGGADARLAIYTPWGEIPFAGHPVLGAAAALVDAHDGELVLETGAGPVQVTVQAAGIARAEVWMAQPWPRAVDVDAGLVRSALGLPARTLVAGYDNGARYALVALATPADVARLAPDPAPLRRLGHGVLCFAGAGLAWRARMFAPALGVAEDPATGSAAGPLAVHLHALERLATGGTIHIEQGAEIGRPSALRARVAANAEGTLGVSVGGHAVIVARGTFWLRPDDLDAHRAG
jgi:trans-2,3-dihydro-3-hydroxyanthranilate isomerase